MNHYNTSDLNQTKCNEKNGINVCTKLCTFLLFYKGMNNKSQESLQISIKSIKIMKIENVSIKMML